jgi:hypothetical protein
LRNAERKFKKGSCPRMTGTDSLNIPSGVFCPRVRDRSASSKRINGSLH